MPHQKATASSARIFALLQTAAQRREALIVDWVEDFDTHTDAAAPHSRNSLEAVSVELDALQAEIDYCTHRLRVLHMRDAVTRQRIRTDRHKFIVGLSRLAHAFGNTARLTRSYFFPGTVSF